MSNIGDTLTEVINKRGHDENIGTLEFDDLRLGHCVYKEDDDVHGHEVYLITCFKPACYKHEKYMVIELDLMHYLATNCFNILETMYIIKQFIYLFRYDIKKIIELHNKKDK